MNQPFTSILKRSKYKIFDILSFGRTKRKRAVSPKTGGSFEDAIEIKGIAIRGELTAAEYDWIIGRYGEMHFVWRLAGHSLLVQENKFCECVRIQLRSGEYLSIFFDISDFMHFSRVPNNSILLDARAFKRLILYTPIIAIIAAFFEEYPAFLQLAWFIAAFGCTFTIAYRETFFPTLKKIFSIKEDWKAKDTSRNRFMHKSTKEKTIGIGVLLFAILFILSFFS